MKALQELRSKMTRKEIKTLRDSLGKQGISWEHHLHAMQSENDCKILQLDCFSLKPDSEHESGVPDANGWYVGFGVQYNGVGVAGAAGETSSESEDPEDVADEDDEESSGFDSDPTTETDDEVAGDASRFGSDDDSDKGQIMYGLDEEFYVTRGLKPVTVRLQDTGIDQNFTPGEFVTTARFEVESRRHTDNEEDEDAKNEYADYQALGDVEGDVFVVTHSEDPEEPLDTNTISSGLWCNFVIAPQGLEPPKKLEIPAEKLKTIPLDDEKLAQISAAMADFKLPTPPGWEGVSDKKLLDFINSRV
ncbi:hypothetical protein L5515_009695 [Caenorhabditis briggsae]|uniref:Uncharacterized protein n=2 Tax=Caenorhabditis briggsae TaxID=6238 RepID=A0AAE9FAJ9_CAEBR|nr:hypothetical protein L5515_009695 [Caenorhabditis briggsae]